MDIRNSVLVRRYKNFRNPSNVKTVIGSLIALVLYFTFFFLPGEAYGLPGISLVEQRMVAIFLTAAVLWLSEAIPTWCTSVLIIVVMLLTVSDSALWMFANDPSVADPTAVPLGKVIDYKAIMACFADPVVMLFMGGFVLAIGVEKVGLDVAMAKFLLYPFGTRPAAVLAGFIMVTALFSAFISNSVAAASKPTTAGRSPMNMLVTTGWPMYFMNILEIRIIRMSEGRTNAKVAVREPRIAMKPSKPAF